MSMPPTNPLTPDDEQPGVKLSADRRPPDVERMTHQPYGIAAVLVALLLLLGLLVMTRLSLLAGVNIAVLSGVIAYIVMLGAHPHLPPILLCATAAVLGLYYGLPAALVMSHLSWPWPTLYLVSGLLLAASTGALLSSTVDAEEHPIYPIAASFLGLFVLGNLVCVVLSALGFQS